MITMLTTGSIQARPVIMMAPPATTTPTDTAASAAMCRNAPRMLASLWLPRMNRRAVAVLITTPMAATTTMVSPITGAGSLKRRTASQKIAPQAANSSTALANAA